MESDRQEPNKARLIVCVCVCVCVFWTRGGEVCVCVCERGSLTCVAKWKKQKNKKKNPQDP